MPISKVGDKFLTQSTLYSPTFTCADDQIQTSFQIIVKYKDNQMNVLVNPTSREVAVERADLLVFDEFMTILDKARLTHQHDYSFSQPDEVEWNELRLMVDVRYSAKFQYFGGWFDAVESLGMNIRDLFDPVNDPLEEFDFCIHVEDEEIHCHKVTSLYKYNLMNEQSARSES